MAHRQISRLKWARPCSRPAFATNEGLRPHQRKGIAYERRVAEAIPGAVYSPWFEYCDANGPGFANPDVLWPREGQIVVFEAKFTWSHEAIGQLLRLYVPVLEHIYDVACRPVIVCRRLHRRLRNTLVVDTVEAALAAPPLPVPTLHWLGHGSVFAPTKAGGASSGHFPPLLPQV